MINTKKSKKKRIGLILCSLFICLCSILCIVPFNQQQKCVSADTIDSSGFTFTGSDLSFHYSFRTAINGDDTSAVYPMNLHYIYSSDANNVLQSLGFVATIPVWRTYGDNPIFTRNVDFEFLNSSYFTISNGSYLGYIYQPLLGADVRDTFYFFASTFNSTGNIIMGKPTSFVYSVALHYGSICDYIVYYDNNGNSLMLMHFFYKNLSSSSIYYYDFYLSPYRRYYFNDGLNLTDNEYYNQGYQQGQQNGYNTGYNAGESAGYKDGYSVGQTTGYNNGYSDGMEDSNQYTFLNLLSATIDAPVKYFQSLFNFELLGVNLQGFLTGLFTLCVIVTIVKLCLGG